MRIGLNASILIVVCFDSRWLSKHNHKRLTPFQSESVYRIQHFYTQQSALENVDDDDDDDDDDYDDDDDDVDISRA